MRIAIIGSAGRKGTDFTAISFDSLVSRVKRKIRAHEWVHEATSVHDSEPVTLVSCGAAWRDHIAVAIFLSDTEKYRLELHLPSGI